MQSVYLNIGSNKGDRRENIDRAVALIIERLGAEARVRISPEIHSAPEGYASDAEFINVGVAIDYDDALPFTPVDILHTTQGIEHDIAPDSPHRNADGTYRDRVVDIDIIAIDGITMDSAELTLPHPRAEARRFVMQPMAFLCPGWHPRAPQNRSADHLKKSIAEMGRDSVAAFKTKRKMPVTVVLDNIRSLNNVGSVFRTSDAFRVERIVLCGITATPPAPEIHKTALGAENSVDWCHYTDTAEAVSALRAQGYTIIALEQVHGSINLDEYDVDTSRRYAIIVGNEVSGVDQRVVNMADVCLEIPQEGTKHSLNVAVSTAIAIWHFFAKLHNKL